jgi:hypothetical protein
MSNVICIETHIEELRAELSGCIDPQERNMILGELEDALAIEDAIHENAFFKQIESRIAADDPRIPF